ncbi:MAG: ATPase domain-containing protein, partial [Janthinobacterium lividum]
VVDPLSAFRGPETEVHATLLRMVDLLKAQGITGLFTSLRTDGALSDGTDQGLSSLMDAWVKLLEVEADGERNRVLYVIKARGMSHSNQVREYRITGTGVELIDAYIGPEGVLTGTARLTQEAQERAAASRRQQEAERGRRDVARRRKALERQISELRSAFEAEEDESQVLLAEEDAHEATLTGNRQVVAVRRSSAE